MKYSTFRTDVIVVSSSTVPTLSSCPINVENLTYVRVTPAPEHDRRAVYAEFSESHSGVTRAHKSVTGRIFGLKGDKNKGSLRGKNAKFRSVTHLASVISSLDFHGVLSSVQSTLYDSSWAKQILQQKRTCTFQRHRSCTVPVTALRVSLLWRELANG